MLVALKERTGVRLYGVNYKDQAAAARRFLGRYGNPFAAVGVDGDGRAAIEWGVYGMPETFVVDGKGEYARVETFRPGQSLPLVLDGQEVALIPFDELLR